MDYIAAMEQRKSVRSYRKEAPDEKIIAQLKELLEQSQSGTAKGKVRFVTVTESRQMKEAKTGFLYGIGKIHAPAMVVGICEEEEDLTEIGFCMEKAALFLTAEGYGSCFLGTYDEKMLRSYCKLSGQEKIGIVLVFGKANTDSSFMNKTFRNLAGSSRRKPYPEILLNAEDYSEADTAVDAVKHAIMAPSGNNRQPVRVVIKENEAVFYLKDGHLIDFGIFLANFYLYCLETYDNVSMTKNVKGREAADGMEPVAMIFWQERKACH